MRAFAAASVGLIRAFHGRTSIIDRARPTRQGNDDFIGIFDSAPGSGAPQACRRIENAHANPSPGLGCRAALGSLSTGGQTVHERHPGPRAKFGWNPDTTRVWQLSASRRSALFTPVDKAVDEQGSRPRRLTAWALRALSPAGRLAREFCAIATSKSVLQNPKTSQSRVLQAAAFAHVIFLPHAGQRRCGYVNKEIAQTLKE